MMKTYPIITTNNITNLMSIGHTRHGWISQIRWSPNGDTLAIASAGGIALHIRDFGDSPTQIIQQDAPIKGIAFSQDGKRMASGGADTTLQIWEIDSQTREITESRLLEGHSDTINDVAFSLNGRFIASGAVDQTVRLWSIQEQTQYTVFEGHTDEVSCVDFGLDDDMLLSSSRDSYIYIWRLNKKSPDVLGSHDDWVRQVRVAPNRKMAASPSKDMTVRLWDLTTRTQIHRLMAHHNGADAIAFSPDGKLIASGGRDHRIKLWDILSGELLHTLEAHIKPVMSLDFHPHGHYLASSGGDNIIRLWAIKEDG